MVIYTNASWVLTSLLIVLSTIFITLSALWICRKIVSLHTLRQHHDVAGFTFSIVGVLYSVILGFTVINVQERFNHAEETVYTEATMIADLYRDAIYFDDESRQAIRSSLKRYISYVIENEWSLPQNRLRRIEADAILQELWNSYGNISLDSERTKIWYALEIAKLESLMNARLSREFYSWDHLSNMMWTLLITGAIITICFMFFFGLENLRMQMLMTALLAGYLAFMLYLVYSLDSAFKGAKHVSPTAFEATSALFERLEKEEQKT